MFRESPDLASGCPGDPVFLPATSQHVLFMQHAGLHAFVLTALETTHDRAASGIAASGSITATASDIAILLSTALTS
jgi:hypothetical protein